MIRNLKSFAADVEVAGQTRVVSWDGDTISIHGVGSFVEVAEVLHLLTKGTPTGWSVKEFFDQTFAAVPNKVKVAVVEGQIRAATPIDPERVADKFTEAIAAHPLKIEVVDKTPPERPTMDKPQAALGTKPTDDMEFPPREVGVSDAEDLSVFGRLNRLGEVVDEIVRRGAKDFDAVWLMVRKLKDSMTCAVLENIEREEKGPDGFEDRLRRHCKSKNIPGSL